MSHTALLLIDFQNDYFSEGKWPLSGAEKAVEQGAKLLTEFRNQDLPIVHVRHEFLTADAPFFLEGSEGANIHHSVIPSENEAVILKHKPNSFRDTELQEVLKKLNVKKLIVVGAMSHMCIDAGVRAAVDLGYEVSVAHDACATRDLEFNGTTVPAAHVHAAFMAALSSSYASINSTEELLKNIT
ncbi:cysteine hydrolase family protein [Neptunomonas sp.]|uniref:cysteine hydrolase family protein n=1 Tax=Neptunomonas sp. TaxID=1971898 RepID=UPI0025E0A077|nr:cysteine hydrolase family protein [Neptunomonas sp.]